MKSCVYDLAAAKKMKFETQAAPPAPVKSQVRVKVAAVGLNPVDYKIPEVSVMANSRKGTSVGVDFSGVVEAVGENVSDLKIGDLVFGMAGGTRSGPGTLSELLTVPAGALAKIGQHTELAEAGAAPCAALTALQGLRMVGAYKAKAPLKILVIGASGGVGHMVVQLAKVGNPAGTKVLAVCSGKNAAFVKSLGADEILDYTEIGFDLATAVTDADVVYDCVTPDTPYEEVSKKCLKPTGKYVCANTGFMSDWVRAMVSSYLPFSIERSNFKIVMCNSNTKDLAELAELMSSKKIKVHISKTVKFNEAEVEAAFDLLKSHRTVGKIVVTF